MSALAFSIVALVLVGPVPGMLARASWPHRAPRAAVVLWQSIALAAVLSAFSAVLNFGRTYGLTATVLVAVVSPRMARSW